jgi:hypothetical protein
MMSLYPHAGPLKCEMQLEVHMHYLILKNCTGYKI